jgi:prepilin-type N-terminal cleavage/methylation domain-containing protein
MNKKGYTWVEILIAVFIIAVLAMSIAFVLGFWRDQANDSQKVSDIRKIREALELYFEKHAEYPATLFDLVEEGFLTTVPVPPTSY